MTKRKEFLVKEFGQWHIVHQLVSTSAPVIKEDGSEGRPERRADWRERDGTPIGLACEDDECIPLSELDRLGVAELNSHIRVCPPRGKKANVNEFKFVFARRNKKKRKG